MLVKEVPYSKLTEERQKFFKANPSLTRDEVVNKIVAFSAFCTKCKCINDNREKASLCTKCYPKPVVIEECPVVEHKTKKLSMLGKQCVQCEKPLVGKLSMCEECLADIPLHDRGKNGRPQTIGLHIPGVKELLEQDLPKKKRQQIYYKLRYDWLKEVCSKKGLCIACRGKKEEHRMSQNWCDYCATTIIKGRANDEFRKTRSIKAKALKKSREDAGLCKRCGGERENKLIKMCVKCNDYQNERSAIARKKKYAERLKPSDMLKEHLMRMK